MRPHLQGQLREARSHRHVGGVLGVQRPCGLGDQQERHWITATVLAVAAIASAVATYAASQQAAAGQRYQAKLARNQAINARNAAAVEIQNRRERYQQQMATQRALMGASGAQLGEGSTLLVETDAAEQAALDLARVRYAGEVRATSYQDEARLLKWQGRSTERMGYVQAGASLLQGAAKAYGAYSRGAS